MNWIRACGRKIRAFWLDRLWVDFGVAAAIVSLHFVLTRFWPTTNVLGHAIPADRRAVYTAAAIVVTLLGSFSSIAISQLGSAKGARIDALKAQGVSILGKNWRSIFRAGLLSAMISLFALSVDSSDVNAPVTFPIWWAFEAGVILAVVKFVRLSSLFTEIMEISALSGAEPDDVLADAPEINPDWRNRAA